jgi:DNA-binding MarR family transcriptional regulator
MTTRGQQGMSGQRVPPVAPREQELARLFDETVLLYLRLTALAARLHGAGPLSGPRRTVLAGLANAGPQTVAQMARVRAQSRQRFQPLINALIADGLVEPVPNPAHRQSPLMVLTAKGRRAVARMRDVEARGRREMKIAASARQVAAATAVLRDARRDIERVLADMSDTRDAARR